MYLKRKPPQYTIVREMLGKKDILILTLYEVRMGDVCLGLQTTMAGRTMSDWMTNEPDRSIG